MRPEVGLLEAREHAQQRRLAAAGAAEDREQLAAQDVERNLVDRGDAAEVLGDLADLHQRGGGRLAHRPVFTRDHRRDRARSSFGLWMMPLRRLSRTSSGG